MLVLHGEKNQSCVLIYIAVTVTVALFTPGSLICIAVTALDTESIS